MRTETAPLATAADVAERLHITEDLAKRLSKRDKWPSIKFSSRTIRYSEEHVAAIIAKYESAGGSDANVDPFEQTSRSKAKSA